ncbi:MAG: thioredoxin family protein [Candidatus Zixiibacteriota bacterium]
MGQQRNGIRHLRRQKEPFRGLFSVDWCGWCRKLKSEVLTDRSVITILNASFNAVQVNPDIDSLVPYCDSLVTCRELNNIYGISGYPCACFFNREGDLIYRFLGYTDADRYARILDSVRKHL